MSTSITGLLAGATVLATGLAMTSAVGVAFADPTTSPPAPTATTSPTESASRSATPSPSSSASSPTSSASSPTSSASKPSSGASSSVATAALIPDKDYLLCVDQKLGLDRDVQPTKAQLAGITELVCLGKVDRISTIEGTQYMTGLKRLELQSQVLTDLGPLSGLDGLTDLSLSTPHATDLSPLAGLSGLTSLQAYFSAESEQANRPELDLTPLSKLTGLTTLAISTGANSDTGTEYPAAMVTDIAPLAHLRGLTSLYLGNNDIADVAPLAGLTKLKTLNLARNHISDISALSGISIVNRRENCGNCQIPFNADNQRIRATGTVGTAQLPPKVLGVPANPAIARQEGPDNSQFNGDGSVTYPRAGRYTFSMEDRTDAGQTSDYHPGRVSFRGFNGTITVTATGTPSFKASIVYANTSVNVRSGPNALAETIGTLSKGNHVGTQDAGNGTPTTNGWMKVNYQGTSGWVNFHYLETGRLATATTAVNVRTRPQATADKIATLPKGAWVGTRDLGSGKSTVGEWTAVNYRGQVAWVTTAYVAESPR